MKEALKKAFQQLLSYRERKQRRFVKKGSDRGKLY